jgi:hypothetical protein
MKHEEIKISATETQDEAAPPRLHKPRRDGDLAAEAIVTYAHECDDGTDMVT